MKTPWQAGVVIKIKNPFHAPCLRRFPRLGKRGGALAAEPAK